MPRDRSGEPREVTDDERDGWLVSSDQRVLMEALGGRPFVIVWLAVGLLLAKIGLFLTFPIRWVWHKHLEVSNVVSDAG